MTKTFLIPSLAALLMTSTCHAADPAPVPVQSPPSAVAIFMDPVKYQNPLALAHAPQVNLAGYSPITEAVLVEASKNPALAHQVAENSLIASHNHFDIFNRGPQEDGSPFEACRNFQMEQLGIALSEDHSTLKKYLKDYSRDYGGKVQLATEVQLNSWSPMTLSTKGLASPELNIVEVGHDGVGLNFTPVLEAETTLGSRTPKISCKILSAAEITQIAGYQLDRLKAKHLKKFKDPNAFQVKDLISIVSSTLQTVPRFGYPAHMELELSKVSTEKTAKWQDAPDAAYHALATAVSQAN